MKRQQQCLSIVLSFLWGVAGQSLMPSAIHAQSKPKPQTKPKSSQTKNQRKTSRPPIFYRPGPATITTDNGGATRSATTQRIGGYCGKSTTPITALVPPNGRLIASQNQGSLWVAMPKELSNQSTHEFVLTLSPVKGGPSIQTQHRVPLTSTGLAEITIPPAALGPNSNTYVWELTYVCRNREATTNKTMFGHLGSQVLPVPNINDQRNLTAFYSDKSAWFDVWDSLVNPSQNISQTVTPTELNTFLNSDSVKLGNYYPQIASLVFSGRKAGDKRVQNPKKPNLSEVRNQFQALSQQSRLSQGLSQLSSPSALNRVAQDYADTLARNNCPLVHNCGGLGLGERLSQANLKSVLTAENMIKLPKPNPEVGKRAHEELIKSWPHRRNAMIPEWTETGVGISEGPNDYYVVQIFNQPQGPTSFASRLDERLPMTSQTPRQDFEKLLKSLSVTDGINLIEGKASRDFALFLGSDFIKDSNSPTPPQIAAKLAQMADKTGKRAGLIYIIATGPQLHLYLLAPQLGSSQPSITHKTLPIPRKQVLGTAQQFHRRVTDPSHPTNYLPYAVQLHQWMIEPLQSAIDQLKLDTLLFTLDDGLRSTPMAALHNGRRYLIERYSIALIPSFGLTDAQDFKVEQQRLLAMGITESRSGLSQLPAVETEVQEITGSFPQGKTQVTLNQTSTLEQLQALSREQKYGIIHLATHAQFQPSKVEDSYIQFWNQRLTLDRLGILGRELDWDAAPTVELLVLSACTTALGDRSVELGLAGSAVLAGVKSTVASLWNVNDVSSSAFMIEFYRQLPQASIKSEAIRQTQIAMLRQQLTIENGKIMLPNQKAIPLKSQSLQSISLPLSHPYYWAGHTVIGNWN